MDNNIERTGEIVSPLIDPNLCRICFECKPGLNPCNKHGFCDICIENYIKELIKDGKILSINCPCSQCFYIFSHQDIQQSLSEDWYLKYMEMFNKKSYESNIYFRWCPDKNCSGSDLFRGNNKLTCQTCSKDFCFLCAEDWHPGQKCKGFLGKEFKNWAKKGNVKLCPQCRMPVQKNGGCPHMQCTKCDFHWCWYCLQCYYNHDEAKCFRESQEFDQYWFFILFAMFLPLSILFGYFIFIVTVLIMTDENVTADRFITSIRRFKILYLVSSFLLSPFLMILIFSLAPFVMTFVVPVILACLTEFSFLRYFLWQLLFLVMHPLTVGLFYIVIGLVMIIAPVVGFCAFSYKLFHYLRNKNRRGLKVN